MGATGERVPAAGDTAASGRVAGSAEGSTPSIAQQSLATRTTYNARRNKHYLTR